MKPIYKAPLIEKLKDLRRACEIAIDLLDVVPLRMITEQDVRREGLSEGEFALCDWVVRPRFKDPQPPSDGQRFRANLAMLARSLGTGESAENDI